MSRQALTDMLVSARDRGSTALLPYMTAGLPSIGSTVESFVAMAEAGADAFEIGIPYSDPLMDGPTIQAGGLQAIEDGMTLNLAFEIVGRVVADTGRPCLVMTYANPIFRVGPDEFARRAAEAGAAGLIVADVPLEESAPLAEATDAHGLGLVRFVAPTSTDRRLAETAATEPLFIYGVAEIGVTGERRRASLHAPELSRRVRAVTSAPLVMGVGISTPAQATEIAPHADGVIVGSALVRVALDAADPGSELAAAVAGFTRALQ